MTPVDCKRFAFIALFVVVNTGDCQVADYVKTTGLKVRVRADTAWVVSTDGSITRSILKHDTLIVTTESAGVPSTVTWLLGPDSSRVLKYEGEPPRRMTRPTSFVMTYWEIARLYRLGDTGVSGPTYAFNERPATTTKIGGDTVWMKEANGDSYRSVLRNDTLVVIKTIGTTTRDETWVIKGDSAHQLDKSGKVLLSVRKAVVLAPRRIAEVNESIVNRPPPL